MKRLLAASNLPRRLASRSQPQVAAGNIVKQQLRLSDENRWSNVINVASKAVVALRLSNVRSFDSSFASCSQATGFVVDKELGLILTNRHVVLVGPVTAEAIFENHEGVVCKPIYRDPIHDFGFLKYDPTNVQYMDVGEIELYPKGAQVGKEVRVIGNDAGEKIMVLRGTISRLDREAPFYGHGYNDHDTFYITSASATSGGSSGSPVIDASGRCVALNAGGSTQASTSFFLPLDRITRALDYVRSLAQEKNETKQQHSLSRGTLHTVFKHRPLDEVRRLGLPRAEESLIRQQQPHTTGMLTIGKVLPQGRGAAAGLREGDVLLRIEGNPVTGFVELEDMLDNGQESGKELLMEIQRGNETLALKVTPESLWEVLPNEYVEYSRGIFHPLSINLALNANTTPNGIFVATPGYGFAKCGIPSGSIIREIGEMKISTLDDFEKAIGSFPDGSKVRIRFSHLQTPHVDDIRVTKLDRTWFPMLRRTRILSASGEQWSIKQSPPAPVAPNPIAESEDGLPVRKIRRAGLSHMDEIGAKILKSMLLVYFNVPFEIDGQQGSDYFGTGLIVDKKRGIILCDRNTLTCLAGDARVSVGSSVELSGRPIYLHPTLNFAFLQVDPVLLDSHSDVEEVTLFDDAFSIDVRGGDELTFYGISDQKHVKIIPSLTATSVERMSIRTPSTPRFAAKNFDVVHFDQTPAGTIGGVFVDASGVARALWSSFYVQDRQENIEIFQSTLIGPVRESLKQVQHAIDTGAKEMPPSYQLGVELGRIDFAEASSGYGMPDEWIDALSQAADDDFSGASKGTREVFVIDRIMAATKCLQQIKTGDILLACDGHPVVSFAVLEQFSHSFGTQDKPLPLTILRQGEVIQVNADLTPLSTLGTTRVLSFAGLQIQPTHDAVLYHGFCPANLTNERRGCFISGVAFGSPASSAGIFAVRWIIEVNEVEVDSLDALAVAVSKFKKSGECVRLRLQDLQGNSQVVTVRLDLDFWGTGMLELKEGSAWKATSLLGEGSPFG